MLLELKIYFSKEGPIKNKEYITIRSDWYQEDKGRGNGIKLVHNETMLHSFYCFDKFFKDLYEN